MKKIFGILCLITLSLAGVSCHGDLDIAQKGQVTGGDAWGSQSNALANMYGMMSTFRAAFATDYMYWGEYRTQIWGKGNETQPSRDFVYTNNIASTHAQADWTSLYTTINHANLILKYVPGIGFTDEGQKNQILGAAHFVRAFCYYWIGRIWGDAPVLTAGFESDGQEGLFPSRDPADVVFRQVGDDIVAAVDYLKNASVSSTDIPTLAAAYVMQTDYYLWMAKVRKDATALADARTACDNALAAAAAAGKQLLGNFADIFSVTNKLNPEVLFAWSMKKDEKEGGFQSDWLCAIQYVSEKYVENPVKVGSHQQWAMFTEAFRGVIDETTVNGVSVEDSRARVSYDFFLDVEKNNTTHRWINKYAGTWNEGARIFDSDIIVYRYADLLMFDAEIKNDQNQKDAAVDALNQVAQRAYGRANFYPKTLTKQEVDAAILREREKEFCAEGKLWWDFIRLGVVFDEVPSLVGRENEKNILLWPISNTAMNKNPNLTQTEIGTIE